MQEINCQPRLLYQAKLSFRIKEEIKFFKDKQKLKEIITQASTIENTYTQNITHRKNQKQISEHTNGQISFKE